MKIDSPSEKNRNLLMSIIVVLSIAASISIFDVGILGGVIVGGIIGVVLVFILDKIFPKSAKIDKAKFDKSKFGDSKFG